MKYYKRITDGIITQFGTCVSVHSSQIEINEDEWNTLIQIHAEKPTDTLESIYRLSSETMRYEAFPRTHDETVEWYVERVNKAEMTIDEVPGEYRAEVEEQITPAEPDTEQAVVDSIMQEVSSYGY